MSRSIFSGACNHKAEEQRRQKRNYNGRSCFSYVRSKGDELKFNGEGLSQGIAAIVTKAESILDAVMGVN